MTYHFTFSKLQSTGYSSSHGTCRRIWKLLFADLAGLGFAGHKSGACPAPCRFYIRRQIIKVTVRGGQLVACGPSR